MIQQCRKDLTKVRYSLEGCVLFQEDSSSDPHRSSLWVHLVGKRSGGLRLLQLYTIGSGIIDASDP